MITLEAGNKAPEFSGLNQDSEMISLSQYKGQKVILYFYPRDNTPGCTKEACNFNDNLSLLTEKGFVVIGVSPDSITTHQKFIAKHDLNFQLIADTEKEILSTYGAYGEKKLYGKVSVGVLRSTFIIDEEGVLMAVIKAVKTKEATEQVLKKLGIEA